MKFRADNRHGVVLIVVLGMLALFALVGIVFVSTASQSADSARIAMEFEQRGDPADVLLDGALEQILVGTNDRQSVLQSHGLLEDLYGPPVAEGQITGNWSSIGNGALLEFAADIYDVGTTQPLVRPSGYYGGLVLTLLNGPGQYVSARITGYNAANQRLRIQTTGGLTPASLTGPQPIRFLINGRPFSGLGFGAGLDSSGKFTGRVDARSGLMLDPLDPNSNIAYALLPNPRGFIAGSDPQYPVVGGLGGVNEDYDAPDFQNVVLAGRFWNSSTGWNVMLPSLHRPALINYFVQRSGGNWGSVPDAVKRQICLRPLGMDHFHDANNNGVRDFADSDGDGVRSPGERWLEPDFAGSFLGLSDHPHLGGRTAPAADGGGPLYWDVDCDGDAKPDSVWVDIGLPMQTDAQGRAYKPLVAVLCLDLDSRLNLNVHGSPYHYRNGIDQPFASNTDTDADPTWHEGPFAGVNLLLGGANNQPTYPIPVGFGYSVADINLASVLGVGAGYQPSGASGPVVVANEYVALLEGGRQDNDSDGRPEGVIEGRNGEGYLVGQWTGNNGWHPSDGDPRPRAGRTGVDDNTPAAVQRQSVVSPGEPAFAGNSGTHGYYGSPPDFHAKGSVLLDPEGQPVYTSMGHASEPIDEPFELDVVGQHPRRWQQGGHSYNVDNPFTLEELERLLRRHDPDARHLDSRLPLLAPSMSHHPMNSGLVTVASYDLPSPGMAASPELQSVLSNQQRKLQSITDLFEAALRSHGVTDNQQISDNLMQLISPDLVLGLRMDINRPFGNGADDNPDPNNPLGIVDEPAEAPGETMWNGIPFDNFPDGLLNDRDRQARQWFATNLFALMMLLKDQGYAEINTDETLSLTQRRYLTARRLAQWAINVCDFRDRDNIMSGFEFDSNPFDDLDGDGNTWDVDGDLSTNEGPHRGVVWGCEYPNLLITETLATHNLNLRDSDTDTDQNKKTSDPNEPDQTSDQWRRPEGSMFIEVYCTANSSDLNPSGDLFIKNDAGEIFLDLGKMAGDYAVWRLAVTRSKHEDADYDVEQRMRAMHPASASLEPIPFENAPDTAQPDGWRNFSQIPGGGGKSIPIERIVWFSNQQPAAGVQDRDKIFYNRLEGPVHLRPGHFAAVGPHRSTDGQNPNNALRDFTLLGGTDGFLLPPQGIKLSPILDITTNGALGALLYPIIGSEIKEPLGISCSAADTHPDWGRIGLSASEPLYSTGNPGAYYPIGQLDTALSAIAGLIPLTTLKLDRYQPARGEPLDDSGNSPLAREGIFALLGNKSSFEGYKAVFLQRLADPTQTWHAVTNPYLSVDWMPLDLHVFNGEESPLGLVPGLSIEYQGNLATCQRGDNWDIPADGYPNLWEQRWRRPTAPPIAALLNLLQPVLKQNLVHTLGYLNRPLGEQHKLGVLLNLKYTNRFVGGPARPYAWFTWPNRPLTNPFELLLVPASSPSRLLWDYTHDRNPGTSTPDTYYGDPDNNKPGNPYGHLLSFYFSSRSNADPSAGYNTPGDKTGAVSNYHRLFEYVHVPSRSSGTEDVYALAADGSGELTPFYAPFNRISRYRDPGRVNLNTVTDDPSSAPTWKALTNLFPWRTNTPDRGAAQQWGKVWRSRYGRPGASTPVDFDDSVPTLFANPFRSFASTYNVPPLPGPDPDRLRQRADGSFRDYVESTLLRPDPDQPDRPLLAYDVPNAHERPETNSRYNPYFHYQALSKLGNLVTGRSNVYAIWITVGYFEVDRVPVDPVIYPDGLRLRRELGTETGQVRRERAFYVVDRTIPVACQRGVRHNALKTVQLRRIIDP